MRSVGAVPDVLARHRDRLAVPVGREQQARGAPMAGRALWPGRHALAARQGQAVAVPHRVACHDRVAASRAGLPDARLAAAMLVHGPAGVAEC
ncbi:MAG: hypothetical protein GEU86_12240 [Actinophytocola sp.]|nr:hypothetical protein [Actinophytocola sp.]